MSSHIEICREKYFNYGSYLRSRGYDKDICNLVTSIESGEVVVGPIAPGNNGTGGRIYVNTKISGTVEVNPYVVGGIDGQLSVNGGTIGGSIPSRYGLQVYNGARILGPIYQQTDQVNTNSFYSREHLFSSMDSSTNVIIRGSLTVNGNQIYQDRLNVTENITVNTLVGASGESLKIYHAPFADRNAVTIFNQSQSNVLLLDGTDNWKQYLTFAIDGTNSGSFVHGATDSVGHVRILRGATITNQPNLTTGFDDPYVSPSTSYRTNLADTDVALNVYGGLYVNRGFNGFPGKIEVANGNLIMKNSGGTKTVDISGGTGDAGFSGLVYANDLSANTITLDSLYYASLDPAIRTDHGALPFSQVWNGTINTSVNIPHASGGYTPLNILASNTFSFKFNVANIGVRYYEVTLHCTTNGVEGHLVCYLGMVNNTHPGVTLNGVYTPTAPVYINNTHFGVTEHRKCFTISDVFDMNSVTFNDSLTLRLFAACDYEGAYSPTLAAFTSGSWYAKITPVIY
jgi:hypothetical protein